MIASITSLLDFLFFASSYFRHLSPFPIPPLPLPKENDRASSDHLLLKPET